MSSRDGMEMEIFKAWALFALMLVCFIFLGRSLWKIQVARGGAYQEDIRRQSIRRVRIPGMRGRIYDRNGASLADNVPSYDIALYLEELRHSKGTIKRVMEIINEVSALIGVPSTITERDIRLHMERRRPLPLVAWSNLDEEQIARWAERASHIAGMDIQVQTSRIYPAQASASHLLGYVGRATTEQAEDQEEEPYHYYLPEMVGRAGLEKQLDEMLRGISGGRLVQVDVAGYKHGDLGTRPPVDGRDVQLALDLRIQQAAEKTLRGRRGAIVIMDPRNGDVLALASSPAFNPNDFIPFISSMKWAELRDDPAKPMLNRATAGEYAPGSTFKPVVALAALEADAITAGTVYDCPGFFDLGGVSMRCWYHPGHGLLAVRDALKNSCNVFFFKAALQAGYDTVYHMADALGFGRKTGVEVDYERPGLLPDNAWKRATLQEGWRDGDTCNLAIGQGFLTVTPIQMAVYASALANGGTVYKPRVTRGIKARNSQQFVEIEPVIANHMNWDDRKMELVRQGMRDVVMSPQGTGRRAFVHGVDMAGKTGTAEYGLKGSGNHYGWMIAFAPFDHPRYAAVLIVEEAVSGGVTAAPLVHNLMQEIWYGPMSDAGEGRG